ncbi:tyrosine-type recombinase/integrase [Ramlibacter sp. MMS24-I3-19]|uniref:tyrosine-type recombinase/integrase n=1 Tax=Ramlibacter sp. MMS24-I3-19 TaxID=3416606 RepID=UPI003D08C7C7
MRSRTRSRTTRSRTTTSRSGRQNYGRGLYLLPAENSTGRRWWRFDYQFNGRRKTLSLGVYPDVSVEAAGDKAGAMRLMIGQGTDPSKDRRKKKRSTPRPVKAATVAVAARPTDVIPGSFKDVAERWYNGKLKKWHPNYAPKVRGRLENHLYPLLGRRQMSDIEPLDLLTACQRVVDKGTIETARRVCKIASGVWSLAVVEGWAQRNFFKEVLDQLPMYHTRNFAAITDPRSLATLLKDIDTYEGTFIVKSALRLVPLLMLRPGELRKALWSHIDLENGIMLVPVEHRKLDPKHREKAVDHLVPLARQAVAILKELFPLTGRTGIVFPGVGPKGKFISDGTLNKALRRMGYCTQTEVTGHGFRATARTMLAERLGWDAMYAELQLSHEVPDANGTAYNRTEFEDPRVLMMQAWADFLDELRQGKISVKLSLRERFTPVTLDSAGASTAA